MWTVYGTRDDLYLIANIMCWWKFVWCSHFTTLCTQLCTPGFLSLDTSHDWTRTSLRLLSFWPGILDNETHTRLHTRTRTYKQTHTHIHAHTHIKHINKHTRKHTQIHAHTDIRTHTHSHKTFTHTHTHIPTTTIPISHFAVSQSILCGPKYLQIHAGDWCLFQCCKSTWLIDYSKELLILRGQRQFLNIIGYKVIKRYITWGIV